MPRGRQYYDPIIQAPSKMPGSNEQRIELYPEGDVTDAAPGPLRWVARLIGEDGLIVAKTAGSFDHDDALRQAEQQWPGLQVFELREESEDSTHEGFGPSPRLWQQGRTHHDEPQYPVVVPSPSEVGEPSVSGPPPGLPEAEGDELSLRAFVLSAGVYAPLDDVVRLLRAWAAQYEENKNPSGAMALNEAADMLINVEVE